MEGKGGPQAPLGLCHPHCSPLSAEPTFPASPRSELGGVGTSQPPRPRTPGRLPTEGEPCWAPSPHGDQDRHGTPGTARLSGTPPRRRQLALERGCGEEKRKPAPGKPRGRLRSWLSFRLWLASAALGAAEPRCARGLARAGRAGCQRRPPSDRAVCRAAAAHRAGAKPRRGRRAGAKPRRERRAGPGGGGGKRPLPPGPPLSAGCEGNRIPLPRAAREPVPGSRRLPGASKEEDTS